MAYEDNLNTNPDRIVVGDFDVAYDTCHQGSVWTASASQIGVIDSQTGLTTPITAKADTEDEAIGRLRNKIKTACTLQLPDASLKDLMSAIILWVWRAPSTSSRARRIAASLIFLLVASLFFVDYPTGDSSITRNLSALAHIVNSSGIHSDKGFIDEAFINKALHSAKKRIWFSGVSFRNLVKGNRGELATTLDRGVETKVVLLDPDSPLADDHFMARFSRTARMKDITETLAALTGSEGILKTHGQAGRNQVWTSAYAPIVPMIVVDDNVFVSFLTHVDRENSESAYGQNFLRVEAASAEGKFLLKHFENMLNGDSAKMRYPLPSDGGRSR